MFLVAELVFFAKELVVIFITHLLRTFVELVVSEVRFFIVLAMIGSEATFRTIGFAELVERVVAVAIIVVEAAGASVMPKIEVEVNCPKVTNVPELAVMIPAFFSPMNAINIPIPADIA